ncbi:MAG: MFS transporter [Thermoflexibacter sp.]|jgi:maltose/moltooligosaccharide transporter|nr:MFS transporter [Thermoflexibacter sp.]
MLNIQKKLSNAFYVILSLPSTAMGFALSVQIAALSWILTTKYHLNIEDVGYVWASGPLAGIIGQVVVGIISDKVWLGGGRRRPFILVGGILASLMLLSLPNIDKIGEILGATDILWVAIVVALVLDLSINVSFNPTRSIIADVTPEGEYRTKGYTWMQTISGMFGVLAYLISVFLGNYTLIYLGVFLVFLFSFIPPFFIQEPEVLSMGSEEDSRRQQRKTEFVELFKIYFAHAFTWLGVQTMFVFAFAYFKQKMNPLANPLSDNELGQMISISFAILNTVGFLLPSAILEPLSRKIGRVKTHALSIGLMSLGYLGIVLWGGTIQVFYVLMAVVGIGWAATVSLPFAIMTEKIDKNRTGFFMGIFNLSVVLPQLAVSVFFGKMINEATDKNLVFIICAITLAISAVLWLLVKESQSNTPITLSGGGH